MQGQYTLTGLRFKTLFLLLCLVWASLPNTLDAQGCACTNCPQFMPDNFVGEFLINVSGADNPTLGQGGQGVCGVNMHFDHEYLGDLSITLTSPGGQTVTLVGPIGFFGATDGSSWDVSFLPCNDPVNPDPGFDEEWHNNQGWGVGNNYFGSYYPSNGCLENFNSGPVDGTWTLTVTDGQGSDVGNFYDYEIIFCDPSGISCVSCEANAGNLPQPDVTSCQGSANLNLDLPPTYIFPNVSPPASDYSYTYVVGGTGGVIVAYEPGPDLSSYDPGSYTVCGLSYLTAQESDIPAPNGSLTVAQLNNQLNGNTPPFCGNITSNCVNVVINAAPPDEEEFVEICAPACHFFYGTSYCQSGTYPRTITNAQGCVFNATLHLTVNQRSFTNLVEFICDGGCPTTPGFEGECAPGTYQEVFPNALGCDSTVTLTVQQVVVNANANPTGQLDCNNPIIQISGVGSTSGAGVSYFWTASNGGNIIGSNTNLNVTIDAEGDYQLRVCRTLGGTFCCDSTEVGIVDNSVPPAPPAAITGPASLCQGETATFTATLVPSATSYSWTLPPGVVANGNATGNVISVTWNSGSSGQICAASVNDCGTSLPVCLDVSITPAPPPNTPLGADTLCAGAQEAYNIPLIVGATDYNWSVTGGTIASGQGTTNVIINWGMGSNGQICVNATSNCGISQDVCLPVQILAPPVAPVVQGDSVACPGGTEFFNLTPVNGATQYTWTVTNGIVVSGQGTDTLQLMWNANASSGTVCVSASNTCGASVDSCFEANLSIPTAGQITRVCDGTNTNYTVSFPISGGTAPYNIPGGTITGGIFTSDPILSGQPYNFQVSDTNACISGVISGAFSCICATDAGTMDLTPLSACEGDSVTATHLGGEMLDANDVTAFVLHSGSGNALIPPIFGQNTSGTFGFQAGMSYEQTYYISFMVGDNLAGFPDPNDPCLSVTQGQPVVFHENPMANAGLDRDTCGLTQPLGANVGVGLGQWSVLSSPAGDSLIINSLQNPITSATASGHGIFSLVWTLNNSGCVDADTVILAFNTSPSIAGVTTVCDATNEAYRVSFQILNGTPNYTVSGTPTGNLSGNTFLSDPLPSGEAYTLLVTDSAGCVSAPLNGSFTCTCSSDAGEMELSLLSTCEGGSLTAHHLGGEILDGNDTFSFVLHTLPGSTLGTILDQNNTGTFSFMPGMVYGTTYYVSFVVGTALNGVPNLQDPCLSVTPGQPFVFYQNPVADAGLDLSTCGTVLNLNGNAPAGSTGQWSISNTPSGGILNLSDPQDPTATATATGFGTYTLVWTLAQNGCVGTDQVNLQFNDSPVLDDLVRNCDAANENFDVTLSISGGTAPYTVNGQPITGSTFVSNTFPNGSSYIFNISDANGCQMPQITGAFSCNCATNAGTMSAQTLQVCAGESLSAISNNDFTLDANDITAYVLHSGTGPALGQVFAQNATGSFMFLPGQMQFGTTYYISLVAGNPLGGFPDPLDPCFSVAPGQPVQWLHIPSPNAGSDQTICGVSIDLQAVNSIFNGTWTLVSGPGTVVFGGETDPSSSAEVSANGLYTFSWTEVNGICSESDEVNVTFHALPVVTMLSEICNGTNTEFEVIFSADNGLAPYSVSGLTGSFVGNIFTSEQLSNGSSYAFVLVDANGCESPNISGAQNCDCSTDAGSMQTNPATFCADVSATAVWNNDATLDANDMVQFVLHNGSGAALGSTIFASNNQPVFDFIGSLQFGVTYYISAIAGNNVGGNVDQNDLCLSVSPGTPVRWKPLPSATISGDATLCLGGSTVLSFSGTGTYPLTVDYSVGGVPNSIILTGPQTVTLNVSPFSTSTFTLIEVRDGTAPTCSSVLSNAATVVVNQPVEAGTANATPEFCEGEYTLLQLFILLDDADLGGQWSETSTLPSQTGGFNAALGTFQVGGQTPGVYKFRYQLNALAPCQDDESTVSVIVHPKPTADAGTDKTLNCNVLSANIGGPGTTSGAYQWLLNGDTIGVERQFLAKEGGTYTLLVTTQAGCTDSDQVIITEDNELPQAELSSVRDVRCFGESNGMVSVDSVTSSHQPVLFSLNGAPFGANAQFSGLPAGNYVIILQDANGCESETGVLTVNDPPELLVDLGPDLKIALADSAHLSLQTTLLASELQNIEWKPLLDSTAAGKPYQNFFPLNSWQISVTVTDSSGCTATDRILVQVEKPRNIFIPNVFKPDGNIDPLLYVFGGRDVELIESFQIFDRWGEAVFEYRNFLPNDPNTGWDGRFKGNTVTPGVFVYFAVVRFIDGETLVFKGDVTVIR